MNPFPRRVLAVLALTAALCAACAPSTIPPATVPAPSPPAEPFDPMSPGCKATREDRNAAGLPLCGVRLTEPDGDGVLVMGDSITWQTVMMGQNRRPFYGTMGLRAPDVLAWATQVAPRTDALVVALGTNDTNDDVWGADDIGAWTRLLGTGARCTVVVLPWLTSTDMGHRAAVDDARAWLTARGVPVVDWRPLAETPGVLAPDGVHLDFEPGGSIVYDVTAQAVDARNEIVEQAVAACS